MTWPSSLTEAFFVVPLTTELNYRVKTRAAVQPLYLCSKFFPFGLTLSIYNYQSPDALKAIALAVTALVVSIHVYNFIDISQFQHDIPA